MNVLVACEFSGIVRDAFAAKGHNAWSCDLYWSEKEGNHFQCDITEILESDKYNWDLMIAHPPCTYLCNSGVRWMDNDERWKKMIEAVFFFLYLLNQPIPKICVENPIMHGYARKLIHVPYTQIIQPWKFGHEESKSTCLWLEGLPKLIPTKYVTPKHSISETKNGWVDRSRTYEGIANAMAEQWG